MDVHSDIVSVAQTRVPRQNEKLTVLNLAGFRVNKEDKGASTICHTFCHHSPHSAPC